MKPTPSQRPPELGDPNQAILNATLRLRSELRCEKRQQSGAQFFVIEDPVRNKFFRAGEKEYRFISKLNGKQTIAEVLRHGGDSECSEEEAIAVCKWLIQANLVNGLGTATTELLSRKAKSLDKQRLLGFMNPICFKLPLFNPDRVIKAIEPTTSWIFGRWFLAIWIVLGIFSLQTIGTHWDRISASTVGILAPNQWIWLVVIYVLLKIAHETAHAVACRRYGGEVTEAGVLLLLFTPMAYVNVTSSWRFQQRWKRMVVTAAGMYLEIFISFVAIVVWSRLEAGPAADICFNVFTLGCVTTLLFNANPLMRFDGYFLLSDWLGIPNLYTKGLAWFGDRCRHLLLGTPKSLSVCSPDEMMAVAVYGTLAFFWKILVSIGLIIAASVLFKGIGLVLGIMGGILWFGLPGFKQLKTVFGKNAAPVNRLRVATSVGVFALFGVGLFTFLQGPAVKSAPAIVQLKNEAIIRAQADGFIARILVVNGQYVESGDRLMELRNTDLETELFALQRFIDEAAIQARIFRQSGEIDKAIVEEEKRLGLEQQLAEKQEQIDGLTVTSSMSGIVFQKDLANSAGKFAKQGDVLLTVANLEQKEIIVSIDQSDIDSLRDSSNASLELIFPGMENVSAKLAHVNPAASLRPSHMELCAAYGGPLPVKYISADLQGSEDRFQLLTPRFNAELSIQGIAGDRLQAGQRGRALFRSKSQSLGLYLYLEFDCWLRGKIKHAVQAAPF